MFHIFTFIYLFILHGYIMNLQNDQLPVGLIAQLVKHRTGIAETAWVSPVMGGGGGGGGRGCRSAGVVLAVTSY